MLRFRSSFFNGVQDLLFFRQLSLYSTEVNPNFVNYLVQNLGFSNQQALSTSSKLTNNRQIQCAKNFSEFKFIQNADLVITYFNKIGLQRSQIQSVVRLFPTILMCNVDKTLIPKTEAFQKLGFSESDIAEIASVNPKIFLTGLNTSILPGIQALKELMGSEHHVISILKKSCRLRLSAITKCLVPNVALLRSRGVPIEVIQKSILKKPFSLLRKPEYFRDAVSRVEDNLGIPRSSPLFMVGVVVFSRTTEKSLESKKQAYKSFGWSDSDVASLVRSCPSLLALSEDNIKKKLDFLMNEAGFEPSYLVKRFFLFTCSLEKRVVPRHKVLVVLKEKGLIKKNYSLTTALNYSETVFLKKFVLPFKEAHRVYSNYAGISLDMLTLESSKLISDAI